jgi:ribosomal protein S18 acetylase RimI-like enzyme
VTRDSRRPASGHRAEPLAVDIDDALAAEVLALQREAYAVEAALIGSDGIPALTETLEQLRAAGETWLGVFDTIGLSGAVAWKLLDDGTVDICRLVVAPRAFRGGVATALLDELDRRHSATAMIVSTGSANEPAIALYQRRGFRPVRRREAAPGLMVTELARPATRPGP